MARFLVAGEALVDLVVATSGGEPTARPGGSPLNVAVGLARLEHDVLLVTRIGDDAYGDLLREHAEDSGVRLAPGSVVAGARTSTATATVSTEGQATYDFDIDWVLGGIELPDSLDCVHVGSLGTWLQPGAEVLRAMVDKARANGALVSYDPNVRPALIGDRQAFLASVATWTELADVVKASAEDLTYLVGATAVPPWSTSLDVITGGGDPVIVSLGDRVSTYAPPPQRAVIDTIGAGDSFMAGLLDGLARRGLLDAAAIRAAVEVVLADVVPSAAAAAGITCSREGADPPDRAELDAALEHLHAAD